MQMLSDDDVNVADMTDEELDAAWDLWFDLAQHTNDFDPPYTHGVFIGLDAYDRPGVPGKIATSPPWSLWKPTAS